MEPLREEQDAAAREARDYGYAFVWVAVAVCVVAYYIAYWQLNRFRDFHAADWLALDAAVVGLATIVLVSWQLTLAFQQTRILLRQDELLSRTESLDLFILDGNLGRTKKTYTHGRINQSPSESRTPIHFAIHNSGRVSCNLVYVTIYLSMPNGTAVELQDGDVIWRRAPYVPQIIPGNAAPFGIHETIISSAIFPGRSVRFSGMLVVPDACFGGNPTVAFPVLWTMQSEHGEWPAKSQCGVLQANIV